MCAVRAFDRDMGEKMICIYVYVKLKLDIVCIGEAIERVSVRSFVRLCACVPMPECLIVRAFAT